MKGKGTPKQERIPFLRFSVLSGRTILNLEPSELNTLIQYTHDVCKDGRHRMPNACKGKSTEKKEKPKRLGGVFVKKVDL